MDIRRACIKGNIDQVQKLYKENGNKNSLFIIACRNGHIEIAKWLYSLGGVDIHAKNEEAFRCTCCNGHMKMAKWLHSFGGVNIHAENEYAFRWSCSNGHMEIAKWLYSLGENDIHAHNEYAFRWACYNGHMETAKWLYSLGVDIHAQNEYAFRFSCYNGHMETAKWLYSLDKKILVNAIEYIRTDYDELGINKETSKIIKIITEERKMPETKDPIDDVVVYLLIKYNMVEEINRLNLPYVTLQIEEGKIVDGVIKRIKSKSAKSLIKI